MERPTSSPTNGRSFGSAILADIAPLRSCRHPVVGRCGEASGAAGEGVHARARPPTVVPSETHAVLPWEGGHRSGPETAHRRIVRNGVLACDLTLTRDDSDDERGRGNSRTDAEFLSTGDWTPLVNGDTMGAFRSFPSPPLREPGGEGGRGPVAVAMRCGSLFWSRRPRRPPHAASCSE